MPSHTAPKGKSASVKMGKKPRKKCDKCRGTTHTKDKFWEKGGGGEGKAPSGWQSRKDKAKGKGKDDAAANVATADRVEDTFYAKVEISSDTSQTTMALLASSTPKSSPNSRKEQWVIDLGASHHVCAHQSWFSSYTSLSTPIRVRIGNSRHINAISTGCVTVETKVNGETKPLTLKNVLHVPNLHINLLSVHQLDAHGFKAAFSQGTCRIFNESDHTIGIAKHDGSLYALQVTVMTATAYIASVPLDVRPGDEFALAACSLGAKASLGTWHQRQDMLIMN
jgi:hypothetical protein